MTRVLSELLGANEPSFHRVLSRLESASGHNSLDIQFSTEVERATKLKLKELGLDPSDTTGIELYETLQQKVRVDDARLVATLRQKYDFDDNQNDSIAKALLSLPVSRSCFALQTTVAKRLLNNQHPKHVMRALHYRSLDSMLRREQIVTIFAAAWMLESTSWRRAMLESYKKLKPSDFEIRQMEIITPDSRYWQKLAKEVVTHRKHSIIALKEFGSIVLLPLPDEIPPATILTSFILALHEMNEVRACSTFLKLCQVKPNFGKLVQIVAADEPVLFAELLDQPVPWQIIQRYYARFSDRFRTDLFEPQVQQQDLTWHSIEKALSHIEPSLSFWHNTTSLGFLHDHQPVSLNVIDAALNYCNQLPYSNRIVHYLRNNLWHEIMIRYLKHENVEQAVLSNLQSQLVEEPVLV
ncbi:MAG: hypothetical protein ACREF5_03265 [Candidatus Saccharimonadales bacterium]